jgi:hypothetical protein
MLVDKGEARKKQKLKIKEKKMAKPNAEMVYGTFNLIPQLSVQFLIPNLLFKRPKNYGNRLDKRRSKTKREKNSSES